MSSAAGRLLAGLASPRALAIPGYGLAVDAVAQLVAIGR